jgi:hypothetical protein
MPSGRTPAKTSAGDPAAAPFVTVGEGAGRPAESAEVRQALAEEKLRKARQVNAHARRRAVGPLAVAALLIGLLALAGVFFAWLLMT